MPSLTGLAALQRDRLRQLEQQTHQQEHGETEPDHAPELLVDGLGRNPPGTQKPHHGTSEALGWPTQHRNRWSLLLQQLQPARTALRTKSKREERYGATHATDRLKTPDSSQQPPEGPHTLYPWERLAVAARDAQEAQEGRQVDQKGKEAGQGAQDLIADLLAGRHMLWSCEVRPSPPCHGAKGYRLDRLAVLRVTCCSAFMGC